MRSKVKRILRPVCSIIFILTATILTLTYIISNDLPDKFQVVEGNILQLNQPLPIKATYNDVTKSQKIVGSSSVAGTKYQVDLKMFGIIPIKSAEVEVVNEMYVVPSGEPFGIKIFTEGVLIVGMTDVDSSNGLVNPAKNAGLKEGDIIVSIDGKKINSNEEVAGIIEKSDGKTLSFLIQRKNLNFNVSFTPVKSNNEGKYKAGIWVRDSSAGIGTLTFYSPSTGIAAGLGHGICDVDTGEILPLSSGELVGAEIINIIKGKSGTPGELRGRFIDYSIGSLLLNSETGVYGRLNKNVESTNLIPVAMKQDVVEGEAKVITTVNNKKPEVFDCVIEKVHFNDDAKTQNMIIKINDEDLLKITGGIVQGMSGSPIIQNNKLVGAVTHVYVNDSTRGYGIFAENMYYSAKSISPNK